jgi:hypothetical protein
MAKSSGKQSKDKDAKDRESKQSDATLRKALLIAVPIVLAFAIFFVVVLPSLSVPFSTFKSNYLAGRRVAVVASYTDQNQSGVVLQCATQLVQIVAHTRNASTIDFYVLNGTMCTYPIGGLGHQVSLATNTIQNCVSMADAEPSVFLNYSAGNSTGITPYRLYVNGDAQYMARCPIAVDLS